MIVSFGRGLPLKEKAVLAGGSFRFTSISTGIPSKATAVSTVKPKTLSTSVLPLTYTRRWCHQAELSCDM